MASASTGAMVPLLTKLGTLMGEEYSKLKGVRKEVASLEDELRSMKALLEKLADLDELDAPAKEWRNQVKNMSCDIEDCIDDFMHHIGKNNDVTNGFVKKTARLLKKLRVRHQIASKIQEIKTRVEDASERRMRYKLDEYTPKPGNVHIDPRVVAIYKEAAGLVGMDGPMDELAKLLMGEEQELKVASIVGFGGLGKTTLANQVYRKLEGHFECQAFVSVSQKPNIPKLLNKILVEIGGCFSHNEELDVLIKSIKERLQDKRYFIVIDDLWSSSAWDVIQCAFPQNDCSSRVLTTTRIYSVAFACCSYSKQYVHNMRPLSEDDSRRLFFSRVFGSGESFPEVLGELSAGILKKCGGLPLAIISMASLLAGQPKMTWEYVRNSLGSMFDGNPTLEDMKQILDLSYRNLPHHLKTCLLYVGIYPEDYIIEKDDLLRQWRAEGFVSKVHGLDAEDVAGSYFNELINMNMIQPVEMDYKDEVLTCRVHDIMLNLIRVKSAEENFIDVIDDLQEITILDKNIHRVSIQYYGEGDNVILRTINGSVSQVRSVASFTWVFLPSFQGFKYVRVLFLEFHTLPWRETNKIDLTCICQLFLLRYLKIVCITNLQLPNQLWDLRYLETMILQADRGLHIPSDIVRLHSLLHLTVPHCSHFMGGIGSLKSLRTLQNFDLSSSSLDSIKSLGELTNLREIKFCSGRSPLSNEIVDGMCSSLERLSYSSNLTSLVISSNWYARGHCNHWAYDLFDGNCLCTLSRFPRHLRRLHIRDVCLPRIPEWIRQLHDLETLEIVVKEVVIKDDGIGFLAGLPSLIRLRLKIEQRPGEKIAIPSTGAAFPALKHLQFCCPEPFPAFEAEAMCKLQRLDLCLTVLTWEQEIGKWLVAVGVEHLPACLGEIRLSHRFSTLDENKVADAESELRSVFEAHHPGIDLIFERMSVDEG